MAPVEREGAERQVDREDPRGQKPQAKPCQIDGSGALSEFLCHFRLTVKLNEWSELGKGMYLGFARVLLQDLGDGG